MKKVDKGFVWLSISGHSFIGLQSFATGHFWLSQFSSPLSLFEFLFLSPFLSLSFSISPVLFLSLSIFSFSLLSSFLFLFSSPLYSFFLHKEFLLPHFFTFMDHSTVNLPLSTLLSHFFSFSLCLSFSLTLFCWEESGIDEV